MSDRFIPIELFQLFAEYLTPRFKFQVYCRVCKDFYKAFKSSATMDTFLVANCFRYNDTYLKTCTSICTNLDPSIPRIGLGIEDEENVYDGDPLPCYFYIYVTNDAVTKYYKVKRWNDQYQISSYLLTMEESQKLLSLGFICECDYCQRGEACNFYQAQFDLLG